MSSISNKTKAKAKMIEMGILPAFTGKEVQEMLDSLSTNDRRVTKRKFRKAWRKLAKKDPTLGSILFSDSDPDEHTLRHRSCFVVSSLIREVSH